MDLSPAAPAATPPGTDPLSLPATFPVQVASKILGIGRNLTYQLIKEGRYPVRVLPAGSRYRCSRVDLLRYMGYDVTS